MSVSEVEQFPVKKKKLRVWWRGSMFAMDGKHGRTPKVIGKEKSKKLSPGCREGVKQRLGQEHGHKSWLCHLPVRDLE